MAPIAAALLSRAFRVGVFQFTLVPKETLFVPAVNKANMLRGGFGHAFRRLCCVPQCVDAQRCPLASSCPYKLIFEPSPPKDAGRLSKNRDVPRPFVFRASSDRKTKYERQANDEFEFGLVLIGKALDHLPCVLSFRDLASQGLGLNRAKCELKSVKEANCCLTTETLRHGEEPHARATRHLIYDSADRVFHTPRGLDLERWINQRVDELSNSGPCSSPADDPMTRSPDHPIPERWIDRRVDDLSKSGPSSGSADDPMTRSPDPPGFPARPVLACWGGHPILVRFLTPTLLKAEDSVQHRPDFHHVLKRVRDRINALSTFFGSGPLDVDFAGLGERAQQIRTLSCNVEWEERFRTSSKTRQRHTLSGFIGEAVYEGALDEFLPWLALGELVHVGKHTAWGMGQIALSPRFPGSD